MILNTIFCALKAQQDSVLQPVSLQSSKDTIRLPLDSINLNSKVSGKSTKQGRGPKVQVPISDDAVEEEIDYGAKDSIHLDNEKQIVKLFGDAFVKYQDLNLKANYIEIDLKTNIATAAEFPDSVGIMRGAPTFEDGSQIFSAEKMRYNFKSRKGKIFDAASQQGDLWIRGGETKYVPLPGDTTNSGVGIIYNRNAIITTCNHPEPHYGIRSKKQKFIPDKVVVVGASNIEIAGIPTPLWLPFGFFPFTKKQRHGLIFPQDYEYSEQWGFGLRNIGYFIPLNEYMNLSVTGDIYFNGTWGINLGSQYKRNYKYSGNLRMSYSVRSTEDNMANRLKDKSFSINWRHNQDSRAHPTNTFGGSLTFQTNDYQRLNRNDFNSVTQNQISSNINFSKKFPGKPYTLSVGLSHSQNTQTRMITLNFPNIDFRMQRLYPFKRKIGSGEKKWFENISVQYGASARNTITATDTTFFSTETLKRARYGVQQTLNISSTFNIAKYLRLTPNIDYQGVLYFQTIQREFDDQFFETDSVFITNNVTGMEEFERIDTSQYGRILTDTSANFKPWHNIRSMGVSLSTDLYGIVQSKKGAFRGIMHRITPNISFNYIPTFRSSTFGYFDEVRDDFFDETSIQEYTVFEGGIYGAPRVNNQGSAQMSYSLTNIIETKWWSKKDSSTRKIRLLDNIVISGNHNFQADSLKWSNVGFRGRTKMFKGLTFMNLSASMTPYAMGEGGERVDRFLWSEDKKLLRLLRAELSLTTRATVRKLRELFGGKDKKSTEKSNGRTSERTTNQDDDQNQGIESKRQDNTSTDNDAWSLIDKFSLTHQFTVRRENQNLTDTLQIRTHSIGFRGEIPLSPKWSISVGNIGYNFVQKRITYPDFRFYRDLHCWEMGMSWQPQRGTYSFFIRVKPSSLGFLNIPYSRNNVDNFGNF